MMLIIVLGPSQFIPAFFNFSFWDYYYLNSGSKVETSEENAESTKWTVRGAVAIMCFKEILISIRLVIKREITDRCCKKKSDKYKPKRTAPAAPPEMENQRLSQGVVISQPDEGTEEVEVETKDEKIRVMTKNLSRVSEILEILYLILEFYVLAGNDYLNDYALGFGILKYLIVHWVLSQNTGALWWYKKKKIVENK